MKRHFLVLAVAMTSSLLLSGQTPPSRSSRPSVRANAAEVAIKQAAEQLANEKKVFDRDLEVLAHLRAADAALVDPMQPHAAVQKAFEQVDEAHRLAPDPFVMEGVIRMRAELESARRSPTTADFGRLRALLAEHATRPATRVVARNAARIQDELMAWVAVQQHLSAHVRTLAQVSGDSVRAAQ